MSNRRILVVDDSVEIQEDFRKVLAPSGGKRGTELLGLEMRIFGSVHDSPREERDRFEVDFASQGTEAVEKIECSIKEARPYSVIFMDVRMPPGIDGIETTRLVWEKDPFAEVVLCTAFSDYSPDEVIEHLGMTDRLLFLRKPFDPAAVIQMANTLSTKWKLDRDARECLEVMRSDNDMKTALLKEVAKMAEMGKMTSGIAHELGTPLAVVGMLSEEIIETAEKMPSEVNTILRSAEKIRKAVERMADIIKGLRMLAREASGEELREEEVKRVIEDTLFFCRGRFEKKGVQLIAETLPENVKVLCRAPQLSQVLLNLLNNAFDAVENFACEDKWVRIEVMQEMESVWIAVTDGGKGVPQDVQKRLFQPFFTTKQYGKGTGMGLSISKSLIESQGGGLSLDPASRNTRFVIRVNRKKSAG